MTESFSDPGALLRAVVEDAHDYAFIILDSAGVIRRWNRGAGVLFGYAPDEIIGLHISTIFTIEDVRAGIPEDELRTAASEGRAEDDRWHVRADGTRFFATGVTTALREENGTVGAYVKLARDATALRRADEERERLLVREQQLNREKDTFFASVSHELRTPLTALSGWITLVERLHEDPQVVADGLANMKQAVEMLTKLVNDLLDTARTRSAKMELSVGRVDLSSVVSDSIEAFRVSWLAKPLAVRHSIAPSAVVTGDVTRLQQIVWNLVANAIKHTPAGGSIDVELRVEDNQAVLEVRDSGHGIEPAFLPYIFEPFRQASAGHGGLGLGLAIARSLVELHGGTIDASSEGTGRGATFRVSLPVLAEAAPAAYA